MGELKGRGVRCLACYLVITPHLHPGGRAQGATGALSYGYASYGYTYYGNTYYGNTYTTLGALRHGSRPMFPGYHPQVRCAMAACGEEFTVVRSGTPSNTPTLTLTLTLPLPQPLPQR